MMQVVQLLHLIAHSMTLDTNGMGTITFAGHGGSSAMSALDDVTPNAYEESWDGVTGADTGYTCWWYHQVTICLLIHHHHLVVQQ